MYTTRSNRHKFHLCSTKVLSDVASCYLFSRRLPQNVNFHNSNCDARLLLLRQYTQTLPRGCDVRGYRSSLSIGPLHDDSTDPGTLDPKVCQEWAALTSTMEQTGWWLTSRQKGDHSPGTNESRSFFASSSFSEAFCSQNTPCVHIVMPSCISTEHR